MSCASLGDRALRLYAYCVNWKTACVVVWWWQREPNASQNKLVDFGFNPVYGNENRRARFASFSCVLTSFTSGPGYCGSWNRSNCLVYSHIVIASAMETTTRRWGRMGCLAALVALYRRSARRVSSSWDSIRVLLTVWMYCSMLLLPLWMVWWCESVIHLVHFLRLKLRIGGLLCWDAVYHCLTCILYVLAGGVLWGLKDSENFFVGGRFDWFCKPDGSIGFQNYITYVIV